MNSNQILEVRFTAKRALYWNHRRWVSMSQTEARDLIALGQAVELKKGQWV